MLPPTIETIGAQAFYFVQNLENITIPEKVNKIEAFAFDRVAKLNTIAFLSKTPVTNIDPSAFNPANVDKSKIHISIRKDAETAYSSNPLWSQFPLHQTSFMAETNGTGNGYTEYFPLSSKAVMIVDTKADVYTYVVRPTVTNPTDGKSYQVRLWKRPSRPWKICMLCAAVCRAILLFWQQPIAYRVIRWALFSVRYSSGDATPGKLIFCRKSPVFLSLNCTS